ncbi:hypothetical protein Bca4012_005994 [Brassica carinata]|uniref:(rape) hypothetical protein n=1 Tax=Brassica napus TaxID=3708 RepID=A0A816IFT5_BRANA|nr:unnamed protein product [Brassica napus]
MNRTRYAPPRRWYCWDTDSVCTRLSPVFGLWLAMKLLTLVLRGLCRSFLQFWTFCPFVAEDRSRKHQWIKPFSVTHLGVDAIGT